MSVQCLLEIVEMALTRLLNESLYSSHNQFGFKLDHGTELCVLTFNEIMSMAIHSSEFVIETYILTL